MPRFFDNKIAFGAIIFVFTIAFAWCVIHGTGMPLPGHLMLDPDSMNVAHGPTLPPDPWEGGLAAHGPTLPPDPWEGGLVAQRDMLPPQTWQGGLVSHGQTIPHH